MWHEFSHHWRWMLTRDPPQHARRVAGNNSTSFRSYLGCWHVVPHFTFSGADTKNVAASISVAGTPEELGRWWLKMSGDQQKPLSTSQQPWSSESRASGRPTCQYQLRAQRVCGISWFPALKHTRNKSAMIMLTKLNTNFCKKDWDDNLRTVAITLRCYGHFSICEADQENMSDWKTHPYTKFLYVPEVSWAQISKVSHMFLELTTTEVSHGVLARGWRSQALRQWDVNRHLVNMI